MNKVRFLLLGIFIFCIIGFYSCKQKPDSHESNNVTEEIVKDTNAEEEVVIELTEHICNENCVEGKCHYKHGEKGHVCTEECNKTE